MCCVTFDSVTLALGETCSRSLTVLFGSTLSTLLVHFVLFTLNVWLRVRI